MFAFTKLYNDKSVASVVDVLKNHVIPFYRIINVAAERIITKNEKKYTSRKDSEVAKHGYENYLKL